VAHPVQQTSDPAFLSKRTPLGENLPLLETMMPKSSAALITAAFLLVGMPTALAQGVTPSLPGAPEPKPGYPGSPRLPQGAQGGSGSYEISAAANEHGAFLWVVDNVQHAVVLCEKTDTREFSCTKKPLP
jgi:hypothetical protein